MHWIDIKLPEPGIHPQMDKLMSAALGKMARIAEIQARDGLDASSMLGVFSAVGQDLFHAVTAFDPEAFSPDRSSEDGPALHLGDSEHDKLRGYHIVTDPEVVDLPWNWLHNGVGFLLEKHPITTGTSISQMPGKSTQRPWMQRFLRSEYLIGDDGSSDLKAILPQLRPQNTARPQMFFVPGHTDRKLRRLIYREAEAIQGALSSGCHGELLADMEIQADPITPNDLYERGFMYQALHFAGPTSLPATLDDAKGEYWMNQLINERRAEAKVDVESQFGLEGEILGVDPITSLLDDVTEKYELNGPPVEVPAIQHSISQNGPAQPPVAVNKPQKSWLLDDGPVDPASLSRAGLLPPMIFSNSFCALPELGQHFVKAGASAFVGPVVPLFSRPARIFASHFYKAFGQGWSVGAAVWQASNKCRREFGDEHPVWLSYGVQGYGSLALPYL
ncbi:MAG: hypothetical protein ACI9UQ_000084 [Candidatus Krumholzibacteriia bacterium]|jgi:hypothetical protein